MVVLSQCSQSVGVVAADADICIRAAMLVVPLTFVRVMDIRSVPLLSNLYGKVSVSFSLFRMAPVTVTRMGAERGAKVSAVIFLASSSVRLMSIMSLLASRSLNAKADQMPRPIIAPIRSVKNLFFIVLTCVLRALPPVFLFLVLLPDYTAADSANAITPVRVSLHPVGLTNTPAFNERLNLWYISLLVHSFL